MSRHVWGPTLGLTNLQVPAAPQTLERSAASNPRPGEPSGDLAQHLETMTHLALWRPSWILNLQIPWLIIVYPVVMAYCRTHMLTQNRYIR